MQALRKCIYHTTAGLFCGILMLLGFAVFSRYVLNDSITWAEEVIRFAFIWMFFLAMGEVSRTGTHLALDLVPSLIHGAPKKILNVFIELANIVFLAILAYYTWRVAKVNMMQKSPALLIPYGCIYMAIPVGSVIMSLFGLQRIYFLLSGNSAVQSQTAAAVAAAVDDADGRETE